MYVLSRVCAEFHDQRGNMIHKIGPADLLKFHEVPDAVRDDPLFRLLIQDGSIELPPKSEAELKKLENDPMAGVGPDGRKVAAVSGEETSAEASAKAGTAKSKSAKAKPAEEPAAADAPDTK